MTGFIAVASDTPRLRVSADDLEALATSYESLRGPGVRHVVSAGDRGRAMKIDNPGADRPGVERQGASWAMSSGVVLHRGSLIGVQPESLDGHFGLLSFDAESDTLLLASDPFGMHTLYTAKRDGKTFISTSSLALAKHVRASPSRLGLSTFVLAGLHFGTMTHWEDVERLNPATVIRFTPRGKIRATYWRPEIDRGIGRLTFADAVRHVTEVAVDSFRVHLAGGPPAWSDLTGGYDTRLLNALLARAGVDFLTNTRDEEPEDTSIAVEVSREAGWPSHLLRVPDDWRDNLAAWIDDALAWGDGNLEPLELAWVLWAHERLSRKHRRLVSGGGGEHLQYFAWKSEFAKAGKSNRVNMDNWLDMRVLRPLSVPIVPPGTSTAVRDDVARRMAKWAEPYASELNTTQLDILYAYKSMGHFGAYRSADDGYLRAILPFYLKPVFTAAFSINHRFRNGHRLMRHMMAHLHPRVSAIRTTKGGPAEPWRPTNVHRFLPYYADLGRRAVHKLVQQRLGRTIFPNRRRFNPADLRARRSVLSKLGWPRGLRGAELRSAPLFQSTVLDPLLTSAYEDEIVDTTLLGRILAVELALRATDAGLE